MQFIEYQHILHLLLAHILNVVLMMYKAKIRELFVKSKSLTFI